MSLSVTVNTMELARRAVACKHWEWLAGMTVKNGPCLGVVTDGGADWIIAEFFGPTREGGGHYDGVVPGDLVPLLGEPGTMGCLLHLVRKAWGDPLALPTAKSAREWTVGLYPESTGPRLRFDAGTEAEALVVALEAAPWP